MKKNQIRHKRKNLLVAAIVLALFLALPIVSHADTGAEKEISYGIHIVKYQVGYNQDFSSEMVHDGSKLTDAKDASGNPLSPLGNVGYTVTRMKEVQHIGSAPTYEVASGTDAFSSRIVTKADGTADVTNLPQGIYQVTEEKSNLVQSNMAPVTLSLPMKHGTGELDDVYIYPKSNMHVPFGFTNPPTSDTPNRLWNTSGNIGSYYQIIWMIVSLVIAGIFGLTISNRSHRLA